MGATKKISKEMVQQSCQGSLIFHSYCIVWLNLFAAPLSRRLPTSEFCVPLPPDLDNEIFTGRFLERGLVTRFQVKGFSVKIWLGEEDNARFISGTVNVIVSSYFDSTTCVSYRLVVEPTGIFCSSSLPLATDHLIVLSAMPVGAEHWQPITGADATSNEQVVRCEISDLFLGSDGRIAKCAETIVGRNEALLTAMARYKKFLTMGLKLSAESRYDTNYVVIDVWEDIAHTDARERGFSALLAEEKIRHIESRHQAELMGILTLYPFEWRYRDTRFLKRVCGENIAIDSDDLVLVGDNVALVIGTYGERGDGSPTNWKEIGKERIYDHVSWPEFLYILEIALAKIHAAKSAFYSLQIATIGRTAKPSRVLQESSMLTIRIGRLLMDMDAVDFSRYAAHKAMYREIEARLGVAAELSALMEALDQIDTAVKNIDAIEADARSRMIKTLLGFITIASVFQVVFQETSVPILRKVATTEIAEIVGTSVIIGVTAGLLLLTLTSIIALLVRWISRLFKR